MPSRMQHSMVRNRAMMRVSPATPTMAVMKIWPRPVMVTTPAMMPAMAQATATDRVFLPPFSSASTKREGVMRFSLLIMLTAMESTVATMAENAMV